MAMLALTLTVLTQVQGALPGDAARQPINIAEPVTSADPVEPQVRDILAKPECPSPDRQGDAIVVCGSADTGDQYRLHPLPEIEQAGNPLGQTMDVKIGPLHWRGLTMDLSVPF